MSSLVTRFSKEELDELSKVPQGSDHEAHWISDMTCPIFAQHRKAHPGCGDEIQSHCPYSSYGSTLGQPYPCYMRHGEYVLRVDRPWVECLAVLEWLEATCPYPKIEEGEVSCQP